MGDKNFRVNDILVQGWPWAKHFKDVLAFKRSQQGWPLTRVGWNPPPVGWVVVNYDELLRVMRGGEGRAGASGLIRDECGQWLDEFSRAIGAYSVLDAEL